MHLKNITTYLFIGALSTGSLFAQDTSNDLTSQPQDSSAIESEKKITLPFKRAVSEEVAGAVTSIDVTDVLKHDNITGVYETVYGRVPGMINGMNVRGLDNLLVVVDGVPRPLSSVNLQEVDQISVLRGAHSALLYGVQARNGVMMITTKRGAPGRKGSSVWVERGMGKAISLPSYLNSADYMEYYNEALANDGLAPLYPVEDIEATRSGGNPLKFPDVDYYSNTYLKETRPQTKAVAEFYGGDDNAQYYVNAGWLNSGSLVKLADENMNRLNLRSNLNFRINDFITSNIDVVAIFDSNKGPNGNFWSDAATLRPNLYPVLIDSAMVESTEALQGATYIDGRYLLGGTSQFQNNIYGNRKLGGFRNVISATGQFSNGINFDLSSLLDGLSVRTFTSFDYNKTFIEGQVNQYAVYQPVWTLGANNEDVLNLTPIGTDKFSGTQSISSSGVFRRLAFYGMINYLRTIGQKSDLSVSVLVYGDKYQQTEILQDDNHTHFAGNLNYVFDKKFIVDFNAAYVYSAKLPPGNRTGLSPSLALGWVLSEENFLKDNNTVDFLKFNVSAGSVKTDMSINQYYLYKNTYIEGGAYTWGDGIRTNNTTVFTGVGNDDLFFETRNEVNIGLDALLFDRSVGLNANVFWQSISDQLVRRENNYPAYLGGFVPYENFVEDRFTGIELGASWKKSMGDFGFDLGLTFTYLNSEAVSRDERWEFGYQYRAGRPVSAFFGLEADGLFQDQEEIDNHAVQSFGAVQPGDIKYVDQNGDGVVDMNDEVVIGQGQPDLGGSLSLVLRYKNFSLFGIASGITGSDRYYNDDYYWIYGQRKYSDVVLDRWTPETASTATYPRLTSQANSNNFRTSSYWLYDNSMFTIGRVQLNYDFPATMGNRIGLNQLGLYLRANNVATFAENKDRILLNTNGSPFMRTYALGIKAQF